MTTVELSLYAPKAQISAEFRHVIENLVCCIMISEQEKYIYDHLLINFVSIFLTSIVLGGIAQNTITIKKVAVSGMTNNEQNASKFANVAFGEVFKFGSQSMSSDEEIACKNFTSVITTSHFTTQNRKFSKNTIDFFLMFENGSKWNDIQQRSNIE